ncbi:S1 family peptidase [Clostridiaceae bacterium M8S5]|nr:S1 family peptidase [Clostridiaceae bacterium M8S5]
MYVDSNGVLNILAKDTDKVCEDINLNVSNREARINYRKSEFSLYELEETNSVLYKNMELLGIDTIEIDQVNNRVLVCIYDMDSNKVSLKDRLDLLLVNQKCISIKNIIERPVDQTVYTIKNGSKLTTDNSRFSSCVGVKWTDSSVEKYGFLTAAHCVLDGEIVYYDNEHLGIPVRRQYSGAVDAVIIERSTTPNTFSQTRDFTDNTQYEDVRGGFPVGTEVTLYGDTTQMITGRILSTNYSVNVGGVQFSNLVKTSYVSLPGDSGGAIKIETTDEGSYLVGIHKGGDGSSYGYYCDIDKVKSALNFVESY